MIGRLSPGARRLFGRLDLGCPLFSAGMGGVAGPELVAAVSNAGGAGVLGLYKAPPERVGELIAETERLTARAYGLNWVPEVLAEEALAARVARGLEASRPSAFVSFFGLPPAAVLEPVRRAGRALVVQVGSADEAEVAAGLGADAVVVQGHEAGGHLLGAEGALDVVARARARLPGVALVVAGGVATGAQFGAFAEAGADAACCGTLFLPALESRAHPLLKRAVLRARAQDTVISDLYEIGWPGRRHRVVRTRRVVEGRNAPADFIAQTRVYGRWMPVPRYSAAVPTVETRGGVEEMAFYCGTSCSDVNAELPASAIVRTFRDELERHVGRPRGAGAASPWTSISRS